MRRWRPVRACRDFLCQKPVSVNNVSLFPCPRVCETRTEVLIGYARGSTDNQNLALWLDAVKQPSLQAACSATSARGSRRQRPELDACLGS